MARQGFGLLGLPSFRRTAWVGPKILLDVVDDISNNGREAFLRESRIDLLKGKSFDARLQRPRRFGNLNFSGAVGGPPAGGITGRQSYTGVNQQARVSLGMGNKINFVPNIFNNNP